MMRKVLIFALLLLSASLSAQKISYEYGQVGAADFAVKSFAGDNNADAVVIYDKGISYFEKNHLERFDLYYARATRIKILSDNGTRWANFAIPIYRSKDVYETLYDIEAVTFTVEDGQLKRNEVALQAPVDEPMDANWILKKLSIPNVKEGTIIEYRYKIRSESLTKMRSWEYQWPIPVLYSEYEVRLNPFYNYNYFLQGAERFDVQTSEPYGFELFIRNSKYQVMAHKLGMKNVAAFYEEPFTTITSDYIIKVDFQLKEILYPEGGAERKTTTWEEVTKTLRRDSKFIKFATAATKAAPQQIDVKAISALSEQERFDAVIDFVKKNYIWNNVNSFLTSVPLKNLIADKKGNSADINLLAIGLLNAVGIEANPVLVSTRDHGRIKRETAESNAFNYVLIQAKVNNTLVLSDATDPVLANNRIPVACINDEGFVVTATSADWLKMSCDVPSIVTKTFEIDLNAEAGTKAKFSYDEYEGDAMKKNFGSDKNKLLIWLDSLGFKAQNISIDNAADQSRPYSLQFSSDYKPVHIGETLVIAPFINETPKVNPLSHQKRTYPIDFIYPRQYVYSSTISIPDGYRLSSLPKTMKTSNDRFELNYNVVENAQTLIVTFFYAFRNAVYPSSRYTELQNYFEMIIKAGNEQIVFEKIK